MNFNEFQTLNEKVKNSLKITEGEITILDEKVFRENISELVKEATIEKGVSLGLAQYIIRIAAQQLGIIPASIHDLYIARGEGKVPNNFTVPAINLRVLTFNAAKAVFNTAMKINAGAFIFEIARSEIGYTDQSPSNYISSILGAAISERYRGPVFVQGDHFQISISRYKTDPDSELQTIKDLIQESVQAGFYNIDIDTSTLVDLSKETVDEQQEANSRNSAILASYIREIEPEGVTVSIGGEIGEVGKVNSTTEELRSYTSQFDKLLSEKLDGAIGLSKISIQSGTSHGGVVLPDGTIAQVSVDFDTILELSKLARNEFSMGGAVQHGASTLPQEAFGKFVEAEACEVHLATNFQNIFYDNCPEDLKSTIYAYLDENHSGERKEGQTDDQFYYKSRKRALGHFKQEITALPSDAKDKISSEWKKQFTQLFESLAIKNTMKYVNEYIKPFPVKPILEHYLALAKETKEKEDVSDLAD